MNKGTKFFGAIRRLPHIWESIISYWSAGSLQFGAVVPYSSIAPERFGEDGKYLLAVGRQYALLCEIEEAKRYVKLAIKADSSLKAEFLDDPAFDPVWESFWAKIEG